MCFLSRLCAPYRERGFETVLNEEAANSSENSLFKSRGAGGWCYPNTPGAKALRDTAPFVWLRRAFEQV